ncbi:MAG: hypothetical protein GXP38_14625 [Chloroflexi bacterium]|nr:hypothetical protein [Chloroflexota bacterium]
MPDLISTLHSPSVTSPPPSEWEERRNTLMILLLVILALAGAWGLKWVAENATHTARLGGGLPDIIYPASWVSTTPENVLWQASDPQSSSSFKTRLQIYTRDLRPGETLDILNVSWPLYRQETLDKFRNLSVTSATAPNGSRAMVFTYAYVADPSFQLGTLDIPVVVQAQDIVWIGGSEALPQLVVLTIASEASAWESELPVFRRILAKAGIQEGGVK